MDFDEIILRSSAYRREKEPMPFERLKYILSFTVGMTAMVLVAIAIYMIIYFCGTAGR